MLTIQNDKLNSAGYYLINKHLFWAEVYLSCSIHKSNTVPTAGVNFTEKGMNLYYNEDFISSLSQTQVNFLILHEVYHLISNHQTRAKHKGYDRHLANVAGDMIINSDILERYVDDKFVSVITNKEGERDGYFLPEAYEGPKVMEPLYEWLKQNPDQMPQPQKGEKGEGEGDAESQAKGLDEGNPIDVHMEDTIPEDMKEAIVQDIEDRVKQRGDLSADVKDVLERLHPPSKNYLRMIKTSIESMGNSQKNYTWQRPGRRHEYSRGFRRKKKGFNLILDVSGSMHGSFEKSLSYIFRNGYEISMYQVDTEVKASYRIKSKRQLQKMKIEGCGGTILQPAIDRVVEESNNLSTIILTDGMTDRLDVTNLRKSVLILSVEDECPIYKDGNSNKVKQVVIE